MEENYIMAKRIIDKCLNSDDEIYPFFVLCAYGLLCKYSDHKEIVEDLFSKTLVLIDNYPLDVIMRNNGIDPDAYYNGDYISSSEDCDIYSSGISSSENNYILSNDSEFVNYKDNPFIVCSTLYSDDADVLMTVIHEFGHLIKGEINSSYPIKDNDYIGYVIRSGLSIYEYRYYPASDTYSDAEIYSTLDEAINCIQTTEAAQYILDLEEIITDSNVLNYLKILNKESLTKDRGYEAATETLRTLWKNVVFTELIENNIVEGNINEIVSRFDGIVGDGKFEELNNLLMTIDDFDIQNLNDSDEMKVAKQSFLEIVNLFNKKTKCFVKTKE